MEEEKEFLLVSQREAIVRINLRDFDDVQTLPLKSVKNVITLEFDMEDNCGKGTPCKTIPFVVQVHYQL